MKLGYSHRRTIGFEEEISAEDNEVGFICVIDQTRNLQKEPRHIFSQPSTSNKHLSYCSYCLNAYLCLGSGPVAPFFHVEGVGSSLHAKPAFFTLTILVPPFEGKAIKRIHRNNITKGGKHVYPDGSKRVASNPVGHTSLLPKTDQRDVVGCTGVVRPVYQHAA
jgi:hypothetical protein